jgi:NitT/TauT family transport system permease protein
MADTLKLTPGQASDVEAASEVVYSQAADEVLAREATLGRDMLALVTAFLILVLYHLQNPLLQFVADFGKAFRNATLQPVLAVGLVVCVVALIRGVRIHRDRLRLIGAVALALWTIYVALAIILKFNLFAVLFGLPQTAFTTELKPDGPLDAVQSALTISTLMEYLALLAVVLLWQPWQRLSVYRAAIRKNAPVLLVLILVLALWEGLIIVLNIQQFLLPRPSVIAATFAASYSKGLISVGWNTFQNAFWGFALGCGLGILTGLVSARFTSFSKALLPLAIAANSVPIVAFAPIMNNWFGALNPVSKVAIVAVLTYFPAMISTVKGLTSVDATSLELMNSYAASPTTIFFKLRFPTALPYIFSALKLSTTLAMIGAIVSEYFGGSTQGLGYRIREDAALFRFPETWASIIVASALGILFYLLVSAVERSVMPWYVGFRDD